MMLVAVAPAACASAQQQDSLLYEVRFDRSERGPRFTSSADSLDWERARAAAENASGFRIAISLFDRRLWAVKGADTLLSAPVAVGMDSTLRWRDSVWVFRTPRGRRAVAAKDSNPTWIPPVWHYVEVANLHGLEFEKLERGRPVRLNDGSRLEVRGDRVQVVEPDGATRELPIGDEIIFDGTLFAPPLNTRHRRIEGELGQFRLDLGGGYLLHGTPKQESIGLAATHGCIRLADADIEWLYRHVPVGTHVYIF
jgi:hypothetical protein